MDANVPRVEAREVAEFVAREEAEQMGDETREEARRVLLQQHHDTQIQQLISSRDKLLDENVALKKRLNQTRTKMTRALEANDRKMNIILCLLLLAVFGTFKPAQDLAFAIIQGLSKGVIK